jgi:hypothetical protein
MGETRDGLKITPISRNFNLEAAFGPPLTHGTLWYGRGYVDFELQRLKQTPTNEWYSKSSHKWPKCVLQRRKNE